MTTFFARSEQVRRDWYVVDANGKTLGRLEKAQTLSAGTYTVRVTDNTIPGNGCSTTTTFTITDTPAVVTIENADIVLTLSRIVVR